MSLRQNTAWTRLALGAALALSLPSTARSAAFVNFETEPALPAQASTFAAAGLVQTYTVPGVYSITGGVVLGNPTFLAAFSSQGSAPNAYGTSDLGDLSLLDTITLTVPLSQGATTVQGLLFNGQPFAEAYLVNSFSGATLVSSQLFSGVPSSTSTDGFRVFSTSVSVPVTRLTINAPNANANGWDFFVDNIVLTDIPEPSGASLLLLGTTALVGLRLWRRR